MTQVLLQQAGQPHPGWTAGILANSVVFAVGYKVLRKGLTREGVAHAWFLGSSVFAAYGGGGFSLVCLYFIFGTLVRTLAIWQGWLVVQEEHHGWSMHVTWQSVV